MDPLEVDEPPEAPNYELKFAADNYQRYFKYEVCVEGENKKKVGVCRKCNKSISRTDGATSGFLKHIKAWRVSKYELLKKLTQRFLCPPPSSVESERLFSQLKMIYTDKRGSLSGEHAEQQLFLRYIWSKSE
jgi:hypothetical protein